MTAPASSPPTFDQLLNLVDRAERKGGLTTAEGDRLRAGLHHLANHHRMTPDQAIELDELRTKYALARRRAWKWKRRATAAEANATPAQAPEQTPSEQDRAALHRVTALAQRWTHIPTKRQAAAAIFAALTNKDPDD